MGGSTGEGKGGVGEEGVRENKGGVGWSFGESLNNISLGYNDSVRWCVRISIDGMGGGWIPGGDGVLFRRGSCHKPEIVIPKPIL